MHSAEDCFVDICYRCPLINVFKILLIAWLMFTLMWQVETVDTVMENDKKDRCLSDKLGLSNYESSPWEVVDGNNEVRRRHRSYKLERLSSQFGGKISCIQQKTMSDDSMKLVINENLVADDVRFGDPFQVCVSPVLHASPSKLYAWLLLPSSGEDSYQSYGRNFMLIAFLTLWVADTSSYGARDLITATDHHAIQGLCWGCMAQGH